MDQQTGFDSTHAAIADAISSDSCGPYLIQSELGFDSLNDFWRETGTYPRTTPDAYAEFVLSIFDEVIIPVVLPEIERRAEAEFENWLDDGTVATSPPSEMVDDHGRPASYDGLRTLLQDVDRDQLRAAARAAAVVERDTE